ncbi:uncharacterized protein [Miscanthus floridulus]|uniref:uncharacterized protein isoform X2 n=1 Tax=Miscanthus floridulus TaxID=154761 RepID=UPI003458C299
MISVGKAKQYANVLDKPLSRGRQEVSLSAFAFLFSELVQYNQTQVDNITELERRFRAEQRRQSREYIIFRLQSSSTSRADNRARDLEKGPTEDKQSRQQTSREQSGGGGHTRRKGPTEAQSSGAGAEGPDRLHGKGGRPSGRAQQAPWLGRTTKRRCSAGSAAGAAGRWTRAESAPSGGREATWAPFPNDRHPASVARL